MQAGFFVVIAVGHCQGAHKGGFAVADMELAAQFGGFGGREAAHAAFGDILGDRIGVGVQAFPEQGLHLGLGDRRINRYGPNFREVFGGHRTCPCRGQRCQTRSHPSARRFAFGRVVVDQRGPAARGGVDSSDLPDQVLVTVSGGELVASHRHCSAIPFEAHVRDDTADLSYTDQAVLRKL